LTPDPIINQLASVDFRQKIDEFKRRGIPAFLGPGALLISGVLTVFSSDSGSESIGIWVPRGGVDVNPDELNFTRLA